jgi:hypothetical protein
VKLLQSLSMNRLVDLHVTINRDNQEFKALPILSIRARKISTDV